MYRNYINLENFNHKFRHNYPRVRHLTSHEFPIPREWQDGAGHMVALPVTTRSVQRPCLCLSQMEDKDMLHATYRLRIADCYRRTRHVPLRDRCP
jgi:hypothetical protein